MNKVITNLMDAQKNIEERTEDLNNANAAFYMIENKYNLLKGKLMEMDRVKSLPNQAMRDAAIGEMLNNDDRFKDIFRDYQQAVYDQEKAKNELYLARDVVKIQVTIANCLTYGKGGEE